MTDAPPTAPALDDLLAQVRHRAPVVVVDLGCGEGALTASLSRRWPAARRCGRW